MHLTEPCKYQFLYVITSQPFNLKKKKLDCIALCAHLNEVLIGTSEHSLQKLTIKGLFTAVVCEWISEASTGCALLLLGTKALLLKMLRTQDSPRHPVLLHLPHSALTNLTPTT